MKARNREINIFNLSMLDVLSCALGAFLIIMIILFPYYNKEAIDYLKEIKQLKQENQAQKQKIESLETKNKALSEKFSQQEARMKELENQNQTLQQENQKQKEKLREAAKKNKSMQNALDNVFLIVIMTWKTNAHDVDLHIVNPSGYEFYFQQKSFSGVPGKLSVDSTQGPGVEVWEIKRPSPGEYKIYYHLYERHGNRNNAVVAGRLYYKDEIKQFRQITLTREKEKVLVGSFQIKENGNILYR